MNSQNETRPLLLSTPATSVFDMNTKAVVSIKAGRLQEGMEILRSTLFHTRTLLMSYNESRPAATVAASVCNSARPAGSAMKCDSDGDSENTIPPLSLFTVPLFASAHPLAPGDAETAHCPLFDRAIVIGSDNYLNADETWFADEHCENVTVGVLLYNLAFCHHLTAIQKGAASADDTRTAVRLYQMALSLFDSNTNGCAHQEEDQCQNLAVLLCALFSNMANIHSRYFHVEETRSCMECLKEVVDSCTNSFAGSCVEDDLLFFYLNVYVTAPVHAFAIAPAA